MPPKMPDFLCPELTFIRFEHYQEMVNEANRAFPTLYPAYLAISIEMIGTSRIIIGATLKDTYFFTEIFPKQVALYPYLSSYCNLINYNGGEEQVYETTMDVEPRTFGQMRLFQRSYFDFQYNLSYAECYPYYVPEQHDILKGLAHHDEMFFRFKVEPFMKSIYENISTSKMSLDHHDYSTKYVLGTNFYVTGLSGSFDNHKGGFFLCGYEPTSNGEGYVFPMPSYMIENYRPFYKGLIADESFNLVMSTDFYEHYNKIVFYMDLKEFDGSKLMKDVEWRLLGKISKDVK